MNVGPGQAPMGINQRQMGPVTSYLREYLLEVLGQAGGLGCAHVCSGGQAVPIEGGKRDLIKVNQPHLPHPRPQKKVRCVAAHALR